MLIPGSMTQMFAFEQKHICLLQIEYCINYRLQKQYWIDEHSRRKL